MNHSAITPPATDPTSIFEHFRGSYGSELLTIAVAHFDIFGRLSRTPMSMEDLSRELNLSPRPTVVLITALRAMGLLTVSDGRLLLTELATEHLVPGGDFDCGNYIGLAANSPGVLGMLQLLKTNRPLGGDDDSGAAFIYRDGLASAMDSEDSARHFTMALAGRAKNVAPLLAEAVPMKQARLLLDLGGGTGIYTFAMLQKNPQLRAIVLDRAEVLKIATELAHQYEVRDRVEFMSGDMFTDELPHDCDTILLSNILHDWDVPECQRLIGRCSDVLDSGNRLLIHDVFLNDEMDGPLPIAHYSAALFSLTEGRAYSAAEYRQWLLAAGLQPAEVVPTLVHCGVISAEKL